MSPRPDAAEHLLAAAVRLLPAGKRPWGDAMRAELASISDPVDRSRFASSCVRATCVTPYAACGLLARAVVGAMVVMAAVFAIDTSAGVTVGAATLLVALVFISAAGVRSSRLGPVAANPVAGVWRMSGYLVLGMLVLWMLWPRAGGGPAADAGGFSIVALLIVGFHVASLRITSRAGSRTLLTIGVTAFGTATIWSALLLVSDDLRTAAGTCVLAVAAAGALAGCSRRSDREATLAVLGAVFATSVLIFIAVGLTYRAAPSITPDVAGTGLAGGLTRADRLETNRNEALDPYVVLLLTGAVAGVLAVGATRPSHHTFPHPAN